MQGYCTLWLPGTDHASIATEAKIVEAMAKEGITKEDIGREKFFGRIVEQLKKLGCSCDWQRERFTMDEGLSRAVIEVLKGPYIQGRKNFQYPVKDSDEFVVVATTRPETMLGDTAVAVHPEDERAKQLFFLL